MTELDDPFSEYLADGWEICGYSVTLMALGATGHYFLLRKGEKLAQATYAINNGKELGRSVNMISPKPEPVPKKGFFG